MTSTLDGSSHLLLVLLRGTGQAAGQQFALLVEEFLEKLRVLVVDVFDAGFLEAAVFFLLDLYGRRVEVSDFRLILCYDCLLLF